MAIAIVGGGAWATYVWYDHLPRSQDVLVQSDGDLRDSAPETFDSPSLEGRRALKLNPLQRIAAWKPRWDWPTLMLGLGLVSFIFTLLGRSLRALLRSSNQTKPMPSMPRGYSEKLNRPDGTILHVEIFEREGPQTVILTHGWSMNSKEWIFLIGSLHQKYRVIIWDLLGLGKSVPPRNHDYSLEKLAGDLKAVIDFSASQNVTLVGHSIGGMIMLTLCKLFPEILGTRVQKLALVHTTYTNPVSTTRSSQLYRAIQKPIIEPLLYIQIGVSPLIWIITWMSYANGSIHRSTMRNGFTQGVSNTKLNFVASFTPRCSPAVLARGALGMLKYDATETLSKIWVPVLIVAASEDPLTPPEASEYMSMRIPNSQLIVLSPAKHFGLIEDNHLFQDALLEFCSGGRLTSLPTGRLS
jgi:pimeloyl-ACP methyl ester carboxylesterase